MTFYDVIEGVGSTPEGVVSPWASNAVLGSSALGNVDGGGVSSSQAEFPTALASSAFLAAFIKSWLALGVLDTGVVLIGALLFDTVNGVSDFTHLVMKSCGGSDAVILDEAA